MFTICFTGHRPDKLGGYDWNSHHNINIRNYLRLVIVNTITESNDNHIKFICGGALGIDQMAFEICNELKKELLSKTIEIELAIPFKKQPSVWHNRHDIIRYENHIVLADKVTFVDTIPKYAKSKAPAGVYLAYKLQLRNEYMVDHSDMIIAVWNGTNGGTCNCVNYAKSINKRILQINPDLLLR